LESESLQGEEHMSIEAMKQKPFGWVNMLELTNRFEWVDCGTIYKNAGEGRTPLYAAPVHASDISQERVDETAKDRHEFEEMVKKGTKAWADTPDNWVDDLRGEAEKQEPVAHLWECLGRWSAYLASHGGEAELAPPQWLCDAINAATAPPKREWVGLTNEEIVGFIALDGASLADFIRCIEAKLRSKNT
jgi:hypothetical protein